jgi:hypothetical protein
MPPPGQAPADAPQPGQPGGGARPETNPYIAAMAPEGTVPVAVYPPFNNYNMKYPTECVLFSELEDFEDAYINDNGNVQLTSVIIFHVIRGHSIHKWHTKYFYNK